MEAVDMGNLSPLKHFEIQWETGEQNDNGKGPLLCFVFTTQCHHRHAAVQSTHQSFIVAIISLAGGGAG